MAVPSFFIKNGTSDFLSRQKSVFDCLDLAEKEKTLSARIESVKIESDRDDSCKRQRKITKHFRGKESLFNKPVELPPRFKKRNRIPDFQRNPHKWTKYSLGDVTQEDMSNESNAAAAMLFLRDIKLRKKNSEIKMEVEEDESEVTQESHIHKFNRPTKIDSKEEKFPVEVHPSSNSYFRNSKLIMPEYVVGQNKKPTKNIKQKIKVEKGKEIFLNHIHEYEDE